MYRYFFKRIFDFIAASIVIVLLLPVFIVVFLVIRLFLGKPVLFKQQRPGLHEKPFWIYKFRTMQETRDAAGHLLEDSQRLTTLGRLLRSLSLDELPALFNVLKGDMSLVGPRPLLMDYLPYYSIKQKKRHSVRPGMTGWAQVNGRNTLGWQQRFEFDIYYAENCTFLFDMKIILLTFIKVIKREGISAVGQATMTRFDHECLQQSIDALQDNHHP